MEQDNKITKVNSRVTGLNMNSETLKRFFLIALAAVSNQWQRTWSESYCLRISLSVIWIIISKDHSKYCQIVQCKGKFRSIIWEKWHIQHCIKSDNARSNFNRILRIQTLDKSCITILFQKDYMNRYQHGQRRDAT